MTHLYLLTTPTVNYDNIRKLIISLLPLGYFLTAELKNAAQYSPEGQLAYGVNLFISGFMYESISFFNKISNYDTQEILGYPKYII